MPLAYLSFFFYEWRGGG